MKMSKVGNQTNSQDPQAVNSRVFVGNLNTFQCSKTDVERMFQRYGRLAGISMHKGYAFVQFTNPFDARSACLGENGRTILSQVLDVNMVAEPKPHQIGRQLQNSAKNGNDWDYYYDSYYASAQFASGPPRLAPAPKRPRLTAVAGPRTKINNNNTHQKTATTNNNTMATATALALTLHTEQIKVYSNPDILICGNCREMFTDLQDLLEHKKTYCKLRFTCKCHLLTDHLPAASSTSLLCVHCKDSFSSAWDLMVHAQAAHTLNIYTLGVPGHHQDNDHDDANGRSSSAMEECSNGHLQDNGHAARRSNGGCTNGGLGESDNEERRGEESSEEGLCESVSSLLEDHQKANGSNSTESSITSFDGDENSHGFDVATSQQH